MRSPLLMSGCFALALGSVGGCANLMERSTVAPEWFEAKAREVKGEGYPSLRDIPGAMPMNQQQVQSEVASYDRDVVALKAASSNIDAATEGETPTPEDIRARAAQLRAIAEGKAPADSPATP
jgi:hypothetical protein